MDLSEALYTTRAMRRLRPDPVPRDVQARILDAAVRAPSGGNQQSWRFLLVDDPSVVAEIAPIYRESLEHVFATLYADLLAEARADPDDPEHARLLRVHRSSMHLAEHFADVPLLLVAFSRHDPTGGSIFPAVWSAMLAARGEGVGSTLTMAMLLRQDDVLRVLGVPGEDGWSMACCVTMGYPQGRWGVAARRPAHEVTFRNRWGEPPGFEVPEPLWP